MVYLQKILVTTDLSEFSLAAMDHASSFGLLYASDLSILHVAELVNHRGSKAAQVTDQSHHKALEEATHNLARFVEQNIKVDTSVRQIVRLGNPAVEICRYVADEHIDLIVMATHGRTGLKHALMGSVAEKVVRMSTAPVLTVKPKLVREYIIGAEDVEHDLHIR